MKGSESFCKQMIRSLPKAGLQKARKINKISAVAMRECSTGGRGPNRHQAPLPAHCNSRLQPHAPVSHLMSLYCLQLADHDNSLLTRLLSVKTLSLGLHKNGGASHIPPPLDWGTASSVFRS
jgi:hypothetical protein